MQPEITFPINLLITVISIFLSLTLGLFLFFNKSEKSNANLFLGGLITVIFPFFLVAFLYRFYLLDYFPHFIGLGGFGLFLIGPFAYFYVRACTQKGYRLKLFDGLHFLPFILNLLMDIPLFLDSGEVKVARYIDFVNNGNIESFHQGNWILLLRSLHGVVYFIISTQLILRYRKHLSNETSAIDTAYHRWMLFFIIILALPVSSIFFYINVDYHRIFIPFQLLSFFLLLLSIYAAALIKPELFHTFPHQMLIQESSEVQKQKYESSNLQEGQKVTYIQKVKAYVEREKPYQSPDLTLAELSEQVNIPAHYLSQVINEKLDCNFLDFINNYRTEAAKAKLVDAKLSHYTIMAIAYEAGFNSKSTFYAAFKKFTGMTPSQYRKQTITADSI